jgi:hypothetical protein
MIESIAPTAELFLSNLGKPLDSVDPEIFKFAYRPNFSLPAHSPIGGIFFKAHGFSITFCAPDFYHQDDRLIHSPAIITNVQLYSGDPYYDHSRYESRLPHDIAFTNSRTELLKKLGPSPWRFPFIEPIKLERWDFSDHWLLVSYTDDMTAIRTIQIGLKHKKHKPSVLPKIDQPDIHTLQSLLERHWTELEKQPCLAGADFSEIPNTSAIDGSSHEVDELKTRGVELYFRPSAKITENFYIFTGARYIHKGLFFSVGFDGALPKGLTFEDTPEAAVKKVGAYPIAGNADELSGYYVWNLPEYMLHVGYSVMEQRVYRIRVAAPSYFSRSLIESPPLEAPVLPQHSDSLPKALQDVWKKENI